MIESVYWMDGYGLYVWAAWLIAGASLTILLVETIKNSIRARNDLAVLQSSDCPKVE